MKRVPNSPAPGRMLAAQLGLRQLGIPEIPKHQLRMLRKLGDGAFGMVKIHSHMIHDGFNLKYSGGQYWHLALNLGTNQVFIGELATARGENTLVAVKHLLKNSTEKDKWVFFGFFGLDSTGACAVQIVMYLIFALICRSDFLEEVRLLASLEDPNVAQVLGACTEEEPFCVLLEFLELGDLCQFLRQNDSLLPNAPQRLDSGTLLYLATQVASGMRFLESRNIVHRDLATRYKLLRSWLILDLTNLDINNISKFVNFIETVWWVGVW